MGYHNGKLQVLPVYSKFPKITAKQLVENWFVGNLENKIPPFALLQNNHVRHINGAIKNLRMMKAFMKVVQRFAIKEEY